MSLLRSSSCNHRRAAAPGLSEPFRGQHKELCSSWHLEGNENGFFRNTMCPDLPDQCHIWQGLSWTLIGSSEQCLGLWHVRHAIQGQLSRVAVLTQH